MENSMLQVETRPGNPVMAGNRKITPFSQSVRMVVPGKPVGFTYNRPVSVLVASPDGTEQVIPIQDVTRRAQIAMLGIALVWAMLLVFFNMIANRRNSNG